MTDDDLDEQYIPSAEEQREIEEILNKEDQIRDLRDSFRKNRIYFHFTSEDHWKGWLKVNGIRWD